MCLVCHVARPKKHVCPVCGKVYKQLATVVSNRAAALANITRNANAAAAAAAAAAAVSAEDEASSEDEWIQCDVCRRWVMVSCDPSIVDLSLYTDKKNARTYSCPLCRKSATASALLPDGTTTTGAAAAAAAGSDTTATTTSTSNGTGEDAAAMRRKREEDVLVGTVLSGMAERFDRLVACAARLPHFAMDDNPAAFQNKYLRETERAMRRALRERNKHVDRCEADCAKERAAIEQEFLQQFRDHLDRACAGHRGPRSSTH